MGRELGWRQEADGRGRGRRKCWHLTEVLAPAVPVELAVEVEPVTTVAMATALTAVETEVGTAVGAIGHTLS